MGKVRGARIERGKEKVGGTKERRTKEGDRR